MPQSIPAFTQGASHLSTRVGAILDRHDVPLSELRALALEMEAPADDRGADVMVRRIHAMGPLAHRAAMQVCRENGRSGALMRHLVRLDTPESADLLRAALIRDDGEMDEQSFEEAMDLVVEEGRALAGGRDDRDNEHPEPIQRQPGQSHKASAKTASAKTASAPKASAKKAAAPKEQSNGIRWAWGKICKAVKSGARALAALFTWVLKRSETVIGWAISAIRMAGELLDTLIAGAIKHSEAAIRLVVKAVRTLSGGLSELLEVAAKLATEFGRRVIALLRELGSRLDDMLTWAARQAAATAKRMVGLLLEAGTALKEMLQIILDQAENVAMTLLKALGKAASKLLDVVRDTGLPTLGKLLGLLLKIATPVAELARWAQGQAKDAINLLYTLAKALKAVAGKLSALLDWAASVAGDLLKRLLARLCEESALVRELVTWAEGVGEHLQALGEAVATARRVMRDVALTVLGILSRGHERFVKGLIAGGAALAELLTWVVEGLAKVGAKLLAALIQAGKTLGEILAAAFGAKEDRLERILAALHALGHSLADLADAAADVGHELAKAAVTALKKLGFAVADVLTALLSVAVNNVALLVTLVLEAYGEHRPLSAAELAAGEKVFGRALKLDLVRISELDVDRSLVGRILARIPGDWQPGAFTTLYLINVPDFSGSKTRHVELSVSTLIHELVHIWQGEQSGPAYMLEALIDQRTDADYNYGYENNDDGETTGKGAQEALKAANGDFSQFNREQQANIIEHYYVRRFEKGLDYSAWEPYAGVVYGG